MLHSRVLFRALLPVLALGLDAGRLHPASTHSYPNRVKHARCSTTIVPTVGSTTRRNRRRLPSGPEPIALTTSSGRQPCGVTHAATQPTGRPGSSFRSADATRAYTTPRPSCAGGNLPARCQRAVVGLSKP